MVEALAKFQVQDWPASRLAAFALLEPVSLWVASADTSMSVSLHNKQGEVVQRFGGNQPVWPIRFGLATAYRDTVTPSLKNADSFTGWALRWRIWLLDVDDANLLLDAANTEMERTRVGPPLMGGRHDAGPDFWRMFRFCTTTVSARAHEVGVRHFFSDSELADLLDWSAALADKAGIGQRPAAFQKLVRNLVAGQHALSKPRTKPTPRAPTVSGFGIGVKMLDPDLQAEVEAFMKRKREKAA